MRELPTGTVTFLFTDVEGSTRLLQQHGDAYADLLAEHRRVLRDAFARHGGVEVDTQGDAFFVAFARPSDALAAAREVQAELAPGPLHVRIGIHTGQPLLTDDGYVGIDVHRAARIAAAAHGAQVLLSQATRDLVGPDGLRDLGEHRLKDLSAPERLFQLGDEDFPPLKTLHQTNLPVQPTPLVGRERELDEVVQFLRDTRIVTLTGAGGTGKTRLALQVAAQVADAYRDGVWFVSLAAVSDPALVEPTIAQVVGARDGLREFLAGRDSLLLLDNLEQLLPAAAPIVAGVGAKVLATSRERLNVAGEQEYPVPPLPVDTAVGLFTQRARAVMPAFVPDEHVVEIARRLDGLPLALELAGARVKVLTTKQIAERVTQGLELLSGGARDAPERHRTLRATIQWSYDLLESEERSVFERLGIFAGGFDLETAERIAGADIDVLASLVDKSLLRRTEEGRFFTLDTIGAFAREHLDDTEVDDLRGRQFEQIKEIAGEAWSNTGAQQVAWLDSVQGLLADIRAVLPWALERDPVAAALAICGLRPFWGLRGSVHEALEWLRQALAHRPVLPDELLAETLTALGWVTFFADQPDAAEPPFREGLELFRQLGNARRAAWATNGLAGAVWALGRHDESLALREQALAEYRALGDQRNVGRTLHYFGEQLRDRGDYDRAREMLAEAISTTEAEAEPDPFALIASLHSLADLELDERRLDEADDLYTRVLATARDVHDTRLVAYCAAGKASVAALRGEAELAGELWAQAEQIESEVGERMLRYERQRYERIIDVVELDADFRRGYDAQRASSVTEA